MARYADTGEILLAIWFACLLGGPYLIFRGIQNFRRQRKVEDTPTNKANVAAQGSAEFQGYAFPSKDIVGPISNKPVAYLKLSFRIYRKFGFKTVSHVVLHPFFLADETGSLLVVPDEAMDISITRRSKFFGILPDENKKLVRKIIETHFPDFIAENRMEQLNVIEEAIYSGSPVYAWGFYQRQIGYPLDQAKPLISLKEAMYSKRRNSLIEFIKGTKSADLWQREFKTSKRGDLSTIPTEDKWHTPYGVLKGSVESPLYIADCWESKLLKRVGSNIGLIVLGAFLFASAYAVLFIGR